MGHTEILRILEAMRMPLNYRQITFITELNEKSVRNSLNSLEQSKEVKVKVKLINMKHQTKKAKYYYLDPYGNN